MQSIYSIRPSIFTRREDVLGCAIRPAAEFLCKIGRGRKVGGFQSSASSRSHTRLANTSGLRRLTGLQE